MNYKNIVNKAEDFIEQNLSMRITIDDVAGSLGISPFHFHRIFRSYTKEPFYKFVSRIKMERSAIVLVILPKLSITEIAFRYGYGDSSSYSRAFKKHFSISPSAFRLARKVMK